MDISALSHGELQKLKSRIEKEIEARNKKQRGQAMDEIRSIVAKYGLKLEEMVANPATRKSRKNIAKAAAKPTKVVRESADVLYRHPDDSQLTWSGGRGRPPRWVNDWKAAGRSLEEARVTIK
jgi:DNA-binding protein H-NS